MEFETIHAKQILTPVGWLENAMVTIKNGKIIKIEQTNKIFSNNIKVLPALIDTHIHGVMGADTMDVSAPITP